MLNLVLKSTASYAKSTAFTAAYNFFSFLK